MKISKEGVDLIKLYEGLRLKPYLCSKRYSNNWLWLNVLRKRQESHVKRPINYKRNSRPIVF